MTFWPPWLGVLLALLLLLALAAWVLHRSQRRQASQASPEGLAGGDVQAEAHKRIQQQHLAELDSALAEGRLSAAQHTEARDELLRRVLADAPSAPGALYGAAPAAALAPLRWGWILPVLAVLSALSYGQLGAPQTWWPLPLSQRVQISATTPEQLAEQTRLWQAATQRQPGDAQAWLTLARLQAAQNAHAEAEQALARVLALAPELDLWIERAQMKALSAGGVYTGEPWQWIQQVLDAQPMHLNARVLAGSAAMSEKKYAAAQAHWQRALSLVPADSEAARELQQALEQATALAEKQAAAPAAAPAAAFAASVVAGMGGSGTALAGDDRPLISGEVRLAPQLQAQLAPGAHLLVYALDEAGGRRPVAIWRGTPTAWPVRFALSDSMGMGAPPLLSSLAQVRLVARISKTGAAQRQADDWQVELPGVKTGVQGVVLDITRP